MSNRTYLSIGDVLSLLREEFPDVTISKIRFLESQGLVNPERSPSGYRKFYEHDVERLRWVLRQQRENFLPLKIIRDRLAGETGVPTEPVAPAAAAHATANGEASAVVHTEQEVRVPAVAATHTSVPSGGSAPAPPPTSAVSSPSPVHAVAPRPAGPNERSNTHAPMRTAAVMSADGAPGAAPSVSGTPSPPPPAPAAGTPSRPAPAVPTAPAVPPAPSASSPAPASSGTSAAGLSRPPAAADGAPRAATTPPTPAPPTATATPGAPPATDAGATSASMTIEELCAATSLATTTVASLEGFGLIEPMVVGGVLYYDEEALTVARTVAEFARYGIEPRHLRVYRNAVDREVGLIEQVVTPLVRQRNPESRQRAVTAAGDLARLGQHLRASLLRRELRRQLGS